MEKKKKSVLKRWWFWVLIVLVIGIGAGSCGGNHGESKNQKAVSDDTETNKSAGKAKEEADTTAEDTAKTDEATVEEQTLMDQSGIKVTLKSLDLKGMFGPELKVCIENSSAQNVTVQANGVSVNGIMTQSVFSCDVAAGKTANDGITLLSSDLDQAGITQIQNVEFTFHVFDTTTYNTIFDTDPLSVSFE